MPLHFDKTKQNSYLANRMMTFDRTQVEQYYAEIELDSAFPQAFCEELFLVGKFTEDTALQQEVGKLLEQNFDATIGKAYKKRKKFPSPDKFNPQTVMEVLFAYGEVSATLDVGKLYSLLGFDRLYISDRQKWLTIPQEVARFTYLRELYVNEPIRQMPDFLDTLTRLEEIHLDILTAFPKCITKLPALKKMEAKLGYMPEMPAEIFEMEQLEELSLRGTQKWDKINPAIAFTQSLHKLKSLKKLDIYYFAQDSLPDDFFEGLENLEELRMGRFANLKRLPTSINQLKNLRKLEIHVMNALEEIPATIGELIHLQEIELGTIPNLQIPIEIFTLPHLEKISFRNVENLQIQTNAQLTSKIQRFYLGELNIWNFFWENVHLFAHLEELETGYLYRQGVQEMPDKISALKNLRKLRMWGSFSRISEQIGELSQLEHLEIHVTDNIMPALPTSIAKLSNLKVLIVKSYAGQSQLVGKASYLPASPHLKAVLELQEFVIDITHEHPLQELELKCAVMSESQHLHHFKHLKRLEWERIESLPAEIGELTALECLHLTGNFSAVPDSVGKLQNLQEVKIVGKQPIQSLPASFGKLTQVRNLHIENYHGTDFDSFLHGLVNVEKLELHHFAEMEALPACFAQFTQLQEFTLHSCKKMKKMGEVVEKMTSLKKLVLYAVNPDADSIYDLARLKNVEHLAFTYWKNLETLPQELTALTKLQFLYLKDADNLRIIPDYIDQFQHLHTLVLEGLQLETLPASLVNLPQLTQMSISNTWFDAPLPEELRALRLKTLWNWQDTGKFATRTLPKSVYKVLLSAGTNMIKEFAR